jgi:RNA polymerase sigma-70 factor (ECF subfamily)
MDMDYNKIYSEYYGKISNYLAGIVGRLEAEDLAQEVFIKIGNSLDKLKDPSKLSSWIFEIALNAARDRLRHRSSEKSGGGRLIQLTAEGTEETHAGEIKDTTARTPEEILEHSGMVECYLDFVRKLPKAHHNIYVLSEFEELSDKEISKRLSLPLETVKMRLHRARAKLYRELRAHCCCYYNERGELMGRLKSTRPPKRFKV